MLMVSVSGSEGTAAQEPVRGSCTCRTRTCQWTCQWTCRWTCPGQQPSGRVLHLEPAVALAAPLHGPLQDGEALVVAAAPPRPGPEGSMRGEACSRAPIEGRKVARLEPERERGELKQDVHQRRRRLPVLRRARRAPRAKAPRTGRATASLASR